jgi:hypothetical protein
MGDDRSKPPPLQRRVPGATRAGPTSPVRPELPTALLQRMQAVVNAAHAQAVQEEARHSGQPDQDAPPEASASLPTREPGAAGAPKPSNGVRWPRRPTAPRGRLSDVDAEFDTDPFLPRVTASGTIASPPVNGKVAQPDQAAQQNHTPQQGHAPQQNHSTQRHTAQQDDTARPDHALRRDRALRRRDRNATKRDRAAQARRAEQEQAERKRAEQEQAEREHAERERAEQTAREQAEQTAREQAEQTAREQAEQTAREQAEQTAREQAERERAEQAKRTKRERAEQTQREQAEQAAEAAWAERERAAHAERERAAQTERERTGQAAAAEGTAGSEQDVAKRPGRAQRTAPSDQAEPDQTASPTGRAAAAVRTRTDLLEHPRPSALKTPGHRRNRMVVLIGVAAVALAAGPLALVLSRPAPVKLSAAEVTRDQAATWVAQQVSSDAVVSCDLTMCQTLRADGVPVEDLLVLGPKARDLLNSQVIVSTAAIRNLFGGRLGTDYAPSVLASFGSGKARIDVRVIAPHGANAYLSALVADLQWRKNVGGQLAIVPKIKVTPLARKQLSTGQVAAQLLLVITELAQHHPLDILAFGDYAQGASPRVPLRCVYLAENGGAMVTRSMLDLLHQQRGYYRAARAETTQRNGQPVLLVEFAAPTPLEVFNSPGP